MKKVAEVAMGTCPVCEGSGRRAAGEDVYRSSFSGKVLTAGYDEATDTLPCRNCGGQTMGLHGTGKVYLRKDGSPCVHEYTRGPDDGRWRCYHHSVCKYCPQEVVIDSSG